MNSLRIVFFIALAMSALGMTAQTRDGEEKLNMQYVGHHGHHSEYYPPADAPEVYFNADDMEIIIVADGFASYYDVDIISQVTFFTDISTQVGGYGDNVDVSSLTIGYYQIVITSSNNNVYEGYFTVE
jgi:hypothetical protein